MNELQLQTGAYKTTFIGTEVIRASTKDEWQNYGEILRRVDEAKQWAIGDWLVDGKRHYGDGLYEEAAGILGIPKGTLQNLKSLSDQFEFSRRREVLSWGHHAEVSPIKQIEETNGKLKLSDKPDKDKMQEFLALTEQASWSVRDLREAVTTYKRRQLDEIRLANEPEKFAVILADPAWEYDFSRSSSRDISNQYMPSTMADMKRLRVPAAENSILFMWATSPKLREALALVRAWGFSYKTCAVWDKKKIGMGYYFRQQHELVLVATRGNLELPDEGKRPPSVISAPRGEHSSKPAKLYEVIETMYPGCNKLEMFARNEREGWQAWGDQTTNNSQL